MAATAVSVSGPGLARGAAARPGVVARPRGAGGLPPRRRHRRAVVVAAGAPIRAPRELTAVESAVAPLGGVLKLAASAALVGGGYVLGSSGAGAVGLRDAGKAVAGAAVAAAGAYAAVSADKVRKGVAAKELFNSLVGVEDLSALTRADVDAVGAKFDVPNLGQEYGEEVALIYDAYLSSLLPSGDQPLTGNEAAMLQRFKDALGLDDGAAAQAHIEVGRRIFRSRMEMGDKDAEVEARKEFQKLVYVSTLVFGEAKAKFLLPWKRVFQVTDAQISVAVREGASKLYRERITALGDCTQPDRAVLEQVRAVQTELLLSDETASEIWRGMAVKRVEEAATRASELVSQRTRARDLPAAKAELDGILDYNAGLKPLEGDASLAAGVGPVTLFGGVFEKENRMSELKELYRMYLAESIKGGTFDDATVSKMDELRLTFGLGAKEAEEMTADVTGRVYRMLIRKGLEAGTIAAEASPAAFLQRTCENLRFAPQSAGDINKEFYLAKLEAALEDKKIDDTDVEVLTEARKLLCIPKNVVREAEVNVCGKIYRKAVEQACAAGVGGFGPVVRDIVKKARADLRLAEDISLEIIGSVVRKVFLQFIRDAKAKRGPVEGAKELRKMTYFNSQVVTPLVQDVQSDGKEAAAKELAEIMKEAAAMAKKEEEEEKAKAAAAAAEAAAEEKLAEADEAKEEEKAAEGIEIVGEAAEAPKAEEEKAEDAVVDVEAKPAEGAEAKDGEEEKPVVQEVEEPKWQKVINVAEDLPARDRSDLYKQYLMFCMTGEEVKGAMGTTMSVERDQKEFVRLGEVGDILGLNQLEVMQVQQGLAEQAFTANAKQILEDGNVTKEKTAALDDMQKQLGLPDSVKEKVVKGILSQKMARAAQSQVAQGGFTLDDLMQMKETGLDVKTAVTSDIRMQLYRQELETVLSDGSGAFETERFMTTLPETLALDHSKVSGEVERIGRDKKRGQLVQAVSCMRQKSKEDAVKALNNLVSCQKASPSVVEWAKREELMDLYAAYSSEVADEAQREALAACLALSESEINNLDAVVASGTFTMDKKEEDVLF